MHITSANVPVRSGRRWAAIAAAAAGLILTAACSSSYGSSGQSSATTAGGAAAPAASAATGSAALRVASSDAGSVLVDGGGRTVYAFAIDTPGRSNCTGACLQHWPVVPASASPAAFGVTATVGSLARPDGVRQLTVNGYPVYTFVGDTGPGTIKGQGVDASGGKWWVVAPTGHWITAAPGSPSSAASSGGYSKGY